MRGRVFTIVVANIKRKTSFLCNMTGGSHCCTPHKIFFHFHINCNSSVPIDITHNVI